MKAYGIINGITKLTAELKATTYGKSYRNI